MNIDGSRNFIPVGHDARGASEEIAALITADRARLVSRWKTDEGKRILDRLKSDGFSDASLNANLGKMDKRFDLRGAPLSSLDLSGCKLKDIDFFAADISKTKLVGADLSGSLFSEANLVQSDLSWTKLKGCFFDSVKFDSSTKLLGVNINEINSNLAILLVDQANTQQRIAHIEDRHPIVAALLRCTCDYGRSISLLLIWAAVLILAFSTIYWIWPQLVGTSSFLDALYFSVVTTTTLGYGDITPAETGGKLVAISQVALGYVLGGLLIAIIARRVITLNV